MTNIYLIIKKELLSFLRDRHTIIYSILFPIAFYPILFWAMNQILLLQRGSLEEMQGKVILGNDTPSELIYALMESDEELNIESQNIDFFKLGQADLRRLKADVIIQTDQCSPQIVIKLIHDSSSDLSKQTLDKVKKILDSYEITVFETLLRQKQHPSLDLKLIPINLATISARSEYILGMLLPMVIIIITIMGGLYPAIEVIVSERERKTIETTLIAPVSGFKIVVAKFIAVVIMSVMAGVLNLFAILLTIKHTLLTSSEMSDLSIKLPLSSFPLIFFSILLIGASFSAAMILIAAFAKTFKEGQSLVTPLYVLGIQPAVVSALPGVPFNVYTALVPVMNVSLMCRELIRGQYDLVPISVTLLVMITGCFGLLALANHFLKREEIVMGLDSRRIFQLLRIRKRGINIDQS